MKIKYLTLSCLAALLSFASLMLILGIPLVSSESIASDNTSWIDQFDDPNLDPRWTIVREDSSYWSLTDRPGYLRITTQEGGLFSNNMRNVLLAEPTLDDFVVMTKVTITPLENFQGAYIHIIQDDDNYIYLGRRYAEGDFISLRYEHNGVINTISLPETATEVYLRLTKAGDRYYGAYSTDSVNWTDIGKYDVSLADLKVGIGASSGPSLLEIPADFDFFQFSPLQIETHYVAPDGACGGPTPCYATIQAAIDAANELDWIKIAAGTYSGVQARPRYDTVHTGVVTQVVYLTKSLTIQGGYTPGNWTVPDPIANPTVVDAQGQGRVIYIAGDIYPAIAGLRITGGDATGQEGEEHGNVDAGGGMYVITATATLKDNQFYGNHALTGIGGGLFLQFSDSTLQNNAIYSNTAKNGGGLGVEGGGNIHPLGWLVTGNLISGNEASDGGGGIATLFNFSGTILNNTISENSGGGLSIFISSLLINDNLIMNNRGTHAGGLSFLGSSETTMINNVIAGNEADLNGTAVRITSVELHMIHNTIANNIPADKSAIYAEFDAIFMPTTLVLTNTILSSSNVGIMVTSGNTLTVNSILWSGITQTVEAEPDATVSVSNEYTGDPAFAPDGYHLTAGSEALNHGIDAGVTHDIDGDPRPIGAGFDLGADEASYVVSLPAILKD